MWSSYTSILKVEILTVIRELDRAGMMLPIKNALLSAPAKYSPKNEANSVIYLLMLFLCKHVHKDNVILNRK